MNTAISVTGTGTREDVSDWARPGPVPPGETGTARPGEGGLPGPDTRRPRPFRPCSAALHRGGANGYCPVARSAAAVAHRGPAVEPCPPEPGDLAGRARAGYAATALTAVITATVVVALLALAHLRAPDPAPVPAPAGIPAAAVPGPAADATGRR